MSGKSRTISKNAERKFFMQKIAEHEAMLKIIDKYITNLEKILVHRNVVSQADLEAAAADATGDRNAVVEALPANAVGVSAETGVEL